MKKFFCGPESFTPDLAPIVGEAPELENYFVAAGLNSIGILTGGGIGRLVAQWIVDGEPDMDVTAINIDRFHKYQANPRYREDRVIESLGNVYKCHYPSKPTNTARGVKRSPIYNQTKEQNAYFRDVSGWEAPDWYGKDGDTLEAEPLTWGRHHWFSNWAAEHAACREGVVLIDMSFMCKFDVCGKHAGRILNRLSTANVDGDVEKITYTQWLNSAGRLEADLTVVKLAEDKFFVVATDTMLRHVQTMMERQASPNDHFNVSDVTGGYAQINLQGPKSRELLQRLTSADVSNEAFPFRAAREIDIGYARALCARITYVGELGYELFIPTEFAGHGMSPPPPFIC
jgi:4-methylaminobutanoate oxidase (formaldehyde-forming)